MAASVYHVISKEVESQIFRHNWIFDTIVYINNPHWQISGIMIFLCKYYIFNLDTLVDVFLDMPFSLLAVILSELYEKPRRNKDWLTEEKVLWEHHYFDCTPSFLVAFFLYYLS